MFSTTRKFGFCLLPALVSGTCFGAGTSASLHGKISSGIPTLQPVKMTENTAISIQQMIQEKLKLIEAYVNGSGKGAAHIAKAAVTDEGGFMGMSNGFAFFVLMTILLLVGGVIVILTVLSRLHKHMDEAKWEKENPGVPFSEAVKPTFMTAAKESWKFAKEHTNPIFVVLTIVGILTFAMFHNWYKRAQDLGLQLGYAPEQPVKFNHRIHAGQLGIQCQYCHTGVEKSKNASIPSVNICMNCHNYVKSGPQYGESEIKKVVDAYKSNKPIRWIRIHNLPDHVYFNHSQHVVAGKLACDNCHGKVAEMERVGQVATLEMGWCINCHRERKVDANNPYYTATFDFIKKHKEVSKESGSYTVAQLGGLECSKCHY